MEDCLAKICIDFSDCVGNIEFPEGLDDYEFEGFDDFKIAINKFNIENKKARLYEPNWRKVVMVDKSKIDTKGLKKGEMW